VVGWLAVPILGFNGGTTQWCFIPWRESKEKRENARDPEKLARRPARSGLDAAFVDANTAGIHATISVLEVEGSPDATDPPGRSSLAEGSWLARPRSDKWAHMQ
jgi:hypothetical protein